MPPLPDTYPSAVQYRLALDAAGWPQIDHGAGGTIHHKPGESFVVKVSEADNAYLDFVRFAAANPAHGLPDVKLVYQGGNWMVAHIKHLGPLSPQAAADVMTWWDNYVAAKKENAPLPNPAEWSTLADQIQRLATDNKHYFDVKPQNFMQRADGTVLFTDPLF